MSGVPGNLITTPGRPIGPFTGRRPVTIPEDAFFVPPRLGEYLQDLLVAVIVRQPPDPELLQFCIQFFQKKMSEEENTPPRTIPDCRYIKEEKAADMLLRREGKDARSADGAASNPAAGSGEPGNGLSTADPTKLADGMAMTVEGEDVRLLNGAVPTVPQGTIPMTFRDTRAEGADIVHDAELHAVRKLQEEEGVANVESHSEEEHV